MATEREQKLVDLMFSVAIAASNVSDDRQEEVCEWVAKNLRDCGFPTTPRGLSWGVLD